MKISAKVLVGLGVLTLSSIAFSQGGHIVKWKCALDVREVRNQYRGPFLSRGRTKDEAIERLFSTCRGALEAEYPGLCDHYQTNKPGNWVCKYSPSYELPMPNTDEDLDNEE